ncbi:MIP family Ig-specific serine endopeptidase [Mesomycoplasma conjunctivae]|uniref:MIP family Ig-specific serine endopeptidase n=1 Tax=Mesomycoplasma conjunctivae TaxID=45361 RepID=UPI003DA6BAFC
MKKIFWFLLLSSSALITVVSCQQNDQKPIKIKTINQKLPSDQQAINNKVDNKVADLEALNLEIDKLKSNLNINKLDIENFVAKIASYKKNLVAKDELIDQTLNSFTTFLEQQNFQIEAKREHFIDFLDQFFNLLNSQDKNNDLKNQDQKLQIEQKEIERLDDKFSVYPGQNHFEFNKNGNQIITDQYRFDNPDREVQHFQSLFGKISTGKTNAKLVDVQAFPKKFNLPEKPIINLLDEKAKSVNQPLYENAQKRAFSLPDLDSTGKIIGLKINNFEQGLTTPAWWGDSLAKGGPNRLGLPRLIPNEKYLKLAKSSIGVTINNGFVDQNSTQDETKLLRSYIPAFSTWNIIDYKLEENGKYPLTWYFLTNAHVANTLRLANDFAENKAYGRDADNYNEKFKQYNTWSISLNKLKSNNELKKVLPTTNGFKNEDFYQKVTLRVKEKNGNIYNNGQDKNGEILINQKPTKELNVRTIVIGTNVLKSKPSDFSRQKVYQNLEEIFDFAIIELTFDNEADAKKITYDYFRDRQDHFRVSKLNLLDAQEYKKFPLKNFYGLGWPLSKGETPLTLSKENDSQNWQTRNFSQSPWVNKPLILFNNSDKSSTLYDQGGNLAWSRHTALLLICQA